MKKPILNILLGIIIVGFVGLSAALYLTNNGTASLEAKSTTEASDEGDAGEEAEIGEVTDFTLEDTSFSITGKSNSKKNDKKDAKDNDKEDKEDNEDEAELDDDYILPNSSSKELKDKDLKDLSAKELTFARNEIYARHGRAFTSSELQKYFDEKDWYEKDDSFEDTDLTAIEKKNADFILSYQKDNGKEYSPN